MTGGSGKDRFVFDDPDTSASVRSADTIVDLKLGYKIDLSAVDANSATRRDDNFTFIGEAAFTKPGQVRFEQVGLNTYVYLNTDADSAAEAVIKLKGAMELSERWFVL